jgi:hypothetical protein
VLEPASGGPTAYYLLRWQGSKGATGPYSDLAHSFIVPSPAVAAPIAK